MLNYTTANLIPVSPPDQRTPAIKIGNIVLLTTAQQTSPGVTVIRSPYVLFVSNDQSYNGNYIVTSSTFNNAPVYELTQ